MAKGGTKTAVSSYKQKVAKNITSPINDEDGHGKLWFLTVAVLALGFCFINAHHLANMFENDRHFSHLADIEREMTYRTEMGLYFSYYKTLVNAKSFLTGLYEITHDNVTEYGHTINTLKRFNLYPEVVLGFLYRQFTGVSKALGWRTQTCWQVNRGEELEPVQSCEGIGNLHYFYIDFVFNIAGTVAGAIFILGVILSDSLIGGLLSVLFFVFNHGESTRVQWTPPLRESFSYPIILAQCALVSFILKSQKSGWKWSCLFTLLAVPAMLSWQFAQFAFFTQMCSLFAVHVLDYCPFATMKTLVFGHLISFFTGFVLLFGNEMLLTSLYFPSILALMIILFLDRPLQRISFRPVYLLLSLIIFLGSTLGLKYVLGTVLDVEDDAHIFDILKSKFSDFSTFHTRLYTCAAEFDFMPLDTLQGLSKTLLLPVGVIGSLMIILEFFIRDSLFWRDVTARDKRRPELLYNVVQLVCFAAMALLIMRLKLFMTPHLAVISAAVLSAKLISSVTPWKPSDLTRLGIAVAIIAVAAYQGKANLDRQFSIRGEYSNPDQEFLFNWIVNNTKPNAVFGGTMPVMANVKLSTERPIVNHPHYEDEGIRERTLKVYSMFSRKPIEHVYNTLKGMGIEYFVFQVMNCAPHPTKPHCSYRSMWDEHDPINVNRPSLCDYFEKGVRSGGKVEPFKMVYNRAGYTVFKL